MNTVVITGSARGLGLELAKEFRKNNYNVVISDLKEESLASAKEELSKIQSDAKIHSVVADVTSESDLEHLLDETQKEFQTIDGYRFKRCHHRYEISDSENDEPRSRCYLRN